MYQCRVCGAEGKDNTQLVELVNVRTDLNEKFTYFVCDKCGCVQILNVPDNLGDYYDNASYYSFAGDKNTGGFGANIKKKLRNKVLGTYAYRFLKREWLGGTEKKLKVIEEINHKDKSQKILDVGCGAGGFLSKLKAIGYNNLLGIDPFLESDRETSNGVQLKKLTIDNVEGTWDQIWMIHSFEHITNPLETLAATREKIGGGGKLIIELPICDSYEYEHYGSCWTGCDAPVHIVMYTKKGLEYLLNEAGLKIVNCYNIANDSFLQLSEMAERGYSLNEVDDVGIKETLGSEKLEELKKIMKKINQEKRSGLVTFVITRK